MIQCWSPLFAELTPEEIGRLGGKTFALLIVLAGIVKCYQISKRPTTSSLCVSSLMCVLIAWGVSVVHTALEESPLRLAIFSIVFTVLLLTALILGIIGLIDYRREERGYVQGKAQAIWGILVSSALLLMIATVAVQTIQKRNAFIEDVAREDSQRDGTTNETDSQVFEDLNFRFDPPGGKWISLSAKKVNPVASVAYVSKKPQVWFMLIAEKLGIENELSHEALGEIARMNLRSAASSVRVKSQRPEVVNGMDGIRMEIDAVVSGNPLSYSTWVSTHNGYAYQLTSFASREAYDELRKVAPAICRHFHLIDPQRVVHAEGMEATEKHRSERWGYEIDFSRDPGWSYLPNDSLEVPAADFISVRGIDGHQVSFGVVPIGLPSEEDDSKKLLARMASTLFNFRNKGQLLRQVRDIDSIWFEGSEISGIERSSSASFGFRLQLVTKHSRAYLLAGWWPPECLSADDRVKAIMDQAKFFEPHGAEQQLAVEQATTRGLLLNELGIQEYSDGKLNDAAKYFASALEYHRTDPNIIENLVNAYFEDQKVDQAEETVKSYLKILPTDGTLRALHAALLRHRGELDESREVYYQLLLDGHENEDDLHSYLTLATDAEEFDQCIEVLKLYTSNIPSVRAKRWLAVIHGRNGDHEEAIQQMIAITEQDSSDRESLHTLGEVYELAGQYSQAVAVCKKLIDDDPEDVSVYLLKGRSEFELKKYPDAQASFAKVLERYPDNAEAHEYQKYLAAFQGKGDRSQIAEYLEPVSIPSAVQQLMGKAEAREADAAESEYDLVEIYKVIGMSYENKGHRRITSYRKYKANTLAGVESLSTLTKSFDPLIEKVCVNRLAVYDSGGRLVAEGAQDSYYVLDDSGNGLASQDRRVHMPVPNLKPGYTIEQIVTTESLGEPDTFGYEDQFLVAIHPLRLGAVYYQGDVDRIASAASKLEQKDVNARLRIWFVESPTAFELEPQQATLEKFLPYVRIADAGNTWEDVAHEYLDRIEPKLKGDADTKTLALKLVDGLTSENEKIATIAKYVQSECTYKAIEFGIRSQVPNTASEVRRNGYGDCKDHSVLLMQLLNAAGVEAHLALINSGGTVTQSLPSLSQFNHMIVCVITGQGTLYLDATEKYTTPMVPKTPGLDDKWTLVLDRDKPALKRTPKYRWAEGQVEIEREVAIDQSSLNDTATFGVRETLSLNPYCSRGLRQYLQAFASRDRRTAIRDLVAEVEKVRINKLVVENLDKPTKNLVLKVEYTMPGALSTLGGQGSSQQWVGKMPAVWEKYLLEVTADDRRVTPMELTLPMAVTSKTKFRLPEDIELLNPGRLQAQEKSKFMEWRTNVKDQDGGLLFESRIRRNSGFFPPEEFEQYWNTSQKVVSAVGGSVRFRKRNP